MDLMKAEMSKSTMCPNTCFNGAIVLPLRTPTTCPRQTSLTSAHDQSNKGHWHTTWSASRSAANPGQHGRQVKSRPHIPVSNSFLLLGVSTKTRGKVYLIGVYMVQYAQRHLRHTLFDSIGKHTTLACYVPAELSLLLPFPARPLSDGLVGLGPVPVLWQHPPEPLKRLPSGCSTDSIQRPR